jgi:hypothetical protein
VHCSAGSCGSSLRDRKRKKRESVGKNFEGVSLKDVWNCAWILEVEEILITASKILALICVDTIKYSLDSIQLVFNALR